MPVLLPIPSHPIPPHARSHDVRRASARRAAGIRGVLPFYNCVSRPRISYRTALRWWKAGQIPGFQAATGTIIVQEPPVGGSAPQRVAVYARVSSHEHQADLDRQAERLVAYCTAKGYQVSRVVQEIASGVTDARPKLLA